MNVANALKLNEWVASNKQQIQLAQKPQRQLANEAAEALGFKVSTNALRDALAYNGIERKSKAERERDVMQSEITRLRELLIKVVTASTVPEWLRTELLNEDVTDDIKAALRKTA